MRWNRVLAVALSITATCAIAIPARVGGESLEALILDEMGDQAGILVHVGCGSGERTAALGVNEHRLVHGLAVSADDLTRARKRIRDWILGGR